MSPLLLLAICSGALFAQSTTVVDDYFAKGNSQLQDLPNNSMWLFNGRNGVTLRTDRVDAVNFDMTPVAGSSEAFWAYFTNSGSPLVLGVGDTLSVSVTFSLNGFANNGQDVRWGVFDSLGTRNTANLTGGQNDATFIGDTGYGLDWFASGSGSPFVLARRTVLSSANVFNSFGDFTTIPGTGAQTRQPLVDGTPYTLTYTIQRLSATQTQLFTEVTGGALSNLNYTSVETSDTPNTSFDYFAFRTSSTALASKITFYELLVQYLPAPPAITAQPQPSALTLQVGGNVSMTVGASGANLKYQWLQNGQPIMRDSARTATLTLTNLQHANAGNYAAMISNVGGAITSNPVILSISDTPVAPPPAITRQPANTKVTLGNTATFSVEATGDKLLYQWFKNGALIPGAKAAQFVIPNAQIADQGSYYVVVSNSSGSTMSAAGTLLVVSAMSATAYAPARGSAGTCIDGPLSIDFSQAPLVGATGKITIFDQTGAVYDSIDMSANPQTKTIGGVAYAYYPVTVNGKTATIYPHIPLAYNRAYSIAMDPGVVTDASGAPFTGFSSNETWRFTTKVGGPAAGATSLRVAADNTGDFCSVQSAIDFVPVSNPTPVTISVGKGTYNEINYVASNKPFITLQGEDRNGTVIQYPNNANLNSGNSRAMFGVDATDFTLQDITLWNTTPHGGSQAEAFRGNNSRITLNRVNLKSFQDTLMLQGTGFVTDSYIEGDVDFMWGNGAVFFQNDQIQAVTSGGYYTQIRNGQGQNGNVYLNCRLTAVDGVTGSYLGRIDPTVFPYSQVVYINSQMGSHITPVGWLLNNSNSAPNVEFWEYNSTDLNGAPLDVTKRLNASRQISASEAAQWSDPGFVLGGWVPHTVNVPPPPPTGAAVFNDGLISVHWSAPVGHSPDDWVGLYTAGSPDANPLFKQSVGSSTTGSLYVLQGTPGAYEWRYFLNDGVTRAAVSGQTIIPCRSLCDRP